MTDAALLWYDFGGDIALGPDGDLVRDDSLNTAILISLFTDARAPAGAVLPQADGDRRGWWYDTPSQTTGSLLWLLEREKMLPEVAERARETCSRALQWLLDRDIAAEVHVLAQLVRPSGLQIEISIRRGNSRAYAYLWDHAREGTVTLGNTTIKLLFV